LQFPAALSECRPREGVELYLHAIEQRPVYPRPDAANNRKLVFYDLLHRSEGFAILSSKKMPKVSCDDMTAFIKVLCFHRNSNFGNFLWGWGGGFHTM
jgi:hypothetical protein